MTALQPSDFERAVPLFKHIPHSRAIVFSVLEGHSPGHLFVDDPHQPTCAFLHATGAYYYAAGDASNQAWLAALPGLIFDFFLPRSPEPEIVLFSFTPEWHSRLSEVLAHRRVITILRKMFQFSTLKYQDSNPGWRSEIPGGLHLRQFDQALTERHPAALPLVDPQTQRFGFCLLDGETITAECSAIFVGDGEAEIDIYTAESYRRRGLARLAACAFIDECLSRGLRPNWACWLEREASYKLALKLGFDELPDVPAILWAEGL
jgi:GNAT superfamily N-acetyltransferase